MSDRTWLWGTLLTLAGAVIGFVALDILQANKFRAETRASLEHLRNTDIDLRRSIRADRQMIVNRMNHEAQARIQWLKEMRDYVERLSDGRCEQEVETD